MAIEDIVQFLEANKGRFSEDQLIIQLRANGYPEEEIRAALMRGKIVRADGNTSPILSPGKKFLHFIVGFFGGGILEGVCIVASGLLGIAFAKITGRDGWDMLGLIILFGIGGFILGIGLQTYFIRRWRKKFPYIAKGILSGLAISIFLVVSRFFFFGIMNLFF